MGLLKAVLKTQHRRLISESLILIDYLIPGTRSVFSIYLSIAIGKTWRDRTDPRWTKDLCYRTDIESSTTNWCSEIQGQITYLIFTCNTITTQYMTFAQTYVLVIKKGKLKTDVSVLPSETLLSLFCGRRFKSKTTQLLRSHWLVPWDSQGTSMCSLPSSTFYLHISYLLIYSADIMIMLFLYLGIDGYRYRFIYTYQSYYSLPFLKSLPYL